MWKPSASTGHRAYKPACVGVGLNVTQIPLGMSESAADRYDSNELLIGFFIPGGEVFSKRVVPYERTWTRRGTDATPRRD